MQLDPTALAAQLATFPDGRVRTLVNVRYLAAQALNVAPDATHMLIETSDQGKYMSSPSFLTAGEHHVAEDEWDACVELDSLICEAASYLSWDDSTWVQFDDRSHPFSNRRCGYYALDLGRIVADAEANPA